jgi:hypothetical protein
MQCANRRFRNSLILFTPRLSVRFWTNRVVTPRWEEEYPRADARRMQEFSEKLSVQDQVLLCVRPV